MNTEAEAFAKRKANITRYSDEMNRHYERIEQDIVDYKYGKPSESNRAFLRLIKTYSPLFWSLSKAVRSKVPNSPLESGDYYVICVSLMKQVIESFEIERRVYFTIYLRQYLIFGLQSYSCKYSTLNHQVLNYALSHSEEIEPPKLAIGERRVKIEDSDTHKKLVSLYGKLVISKCLSRQERWALEQLMARKSVAQIMAESGQTINTVLMRIKRLNDKVDKCVNVDDYT